MENFLLLALSLALSAAPSRAMPVFGGDDRQEAYQSQDPKLRRLAESVPALIPARRILCAGPECLLISPSYKKGTVDSYTFFGRIPTQEDLDPQTRFYGQPRAAHCSGALVAPDLVLTAGHCVEGPMSCADLKVVFGYASKDAKGVRHFPRKNVYRCKGAALRNEYPGFASAGRQGDSDVDFALIKLDRPVKNRAPLKVNASGELPQGLPVLTMGYPEGTPLKIAGNAVVQSVGKTQFYSNLDGFHGNSGGPVFNAQTLEIEGVLATTGAQDYADQSGKAVLLQLPDQSEFPCLLMGATRISAILPDLQAALAGRLDFAPTRKESRAELRTMQPLRKKFFENAAINWDGAPKVP